MICLVSSWRVTYYDKDVDDKINVLPNKDIHEEKPACTHTQYSSGHHKYRYP